MAIDGLFALQQRTLNIIMEDEKNNTISWDEMMYETLINVHQNGIALESRMNGCFDKINNRLKSMENTINESLKKKQILTASAISDSWDKEFAELKEEFDKQQKCTNDKPIKIISKKKTTKKKLGTITLITGPMFSGKTEELKRRINKCKIGKKTLFTICYSGDIKRTGKSGVIRTHKGETIKATSVDKGGLKLTFGKALAYEYVFIDEAQFFDGLVETCGSLADQGVHVVVSGLMSTWKQEPFTNMTNLMAIANKVVLLTAICEVCKDDNAIFSQRTDDSEELEVIGGKDKYIPVCRGCFKHSCEH